MKILVSGAAGLVGAALVARFQGEGHEVIELRRLSAGQTDAKAVWDQKTGRVDLTRCPSPEAVVHLAGETIAQRWTAPAKIRIRNSRVNGTRLLVEALTQLPRLPRVLISASATGYYGDRGDDTLDETSAPGTGFLANVAQAWEAAANGATERGVRVITLRLGVVLSERGGALRKMLPAFRFGLGGRLGSGRQFWSWIALDDLVNAILFCLNNERLHGPINATSPHPVTNREFTRALAQALHRPARLPVPAFMVRLVFGEMGREALLASARVMPALLQAEGFTFEFSEISAALRHLLRR